MCPTPALGRWFVNTRPDAIVLTEAADGETLRAPLQVWYCASALSCGMPVNRAVQGLVPGGTMRHWCGTVVALRFSGPDMNRYSDVTATDLPHLVSFLERC